MYDYFVVVSIILLITLLFFSVCFNLYVTLLWIKEWYSGELNYQFKQHERLIGIPVMLLFASFMVIYYYIEKYWKQK